MMLQRQLKKEKIGQQKYLLKMIMKKEHEEKEVPFHDEKEIVKNEADSDYEKIDLKMNCNPSIC